MFDIKELCLWLALILKLKFSQILQINDRSNLLNDKCLIERNKNHLDKIPVHLAVILANEPPNFETLSKIIFWGLSAGIKNISFYDHKGTLVTKHYELYDHLTKWKNDTDKIAWNANKNGLCGSQIVYKNGFKKELTVNFLSPDDGKLKISEICRSIATNNEITVDQINMDYLSEKFAEIIQPDPDLAIYFGEICCTYGMLPWHIRLTEFIAGKTQQNFTVDKFLGTLYMYAKCEQRFGY